MSPNNNLGTLIDEHKFSDKTALIVDSTVYSYKTLHNLSVKIANGIKSRGILPGQRVAIRFYNSMHFVASYLGILRAGAIVVIINVKLPPAALEHVLEDSGAMLTITQDNFNELLVDGKDIVAPVNIEDPAVILYTSGTMAMPKGVILSHQHQWTIKEKAKTPWWPKRRALIGSPFYHANGLTALEIALNGYATVIIPPSFNADDVAKAITLHKANIISTVPTIASNLIKYVEEHPEIDVSCLRNLILGAAPVSKDLYESARKFLGVERVINGYGLTEVGPGLFSQHPTLPTPDGSVGIPSSGIEHRLVNGVLEVRSPSMMLKYNNITDSNTTADGFYITNDNFTVDENGFYFFVGRSDDMFKSGGNTIYPRQIESSLESHPAVRSSACVGIEDDEKGMKPYAFVVCNYNVSDQLLKEHVLTQLAPSNCPRQIWILNEFPVTSVNKIDKKKLIELAKERL